MAVLDKKQQDEKDGIMHDKRGNVIKKFNIKKNMVSGAPPPLNPYVSTIKLLANVIPKAKDDFEKCSGTGKHKKVY